MQPFWSDYNLLRDTFFFLHISATKKTQFTSNITVSNKSSERHNKHLKFDEKPIT